MNIIPEELTHSVTGNIATTDAVDFMPSIYRLVGTTMLSSNAQWLLKDISVVNAHAETNTVVSILGDDQAKWLFGVPAGQSVQKDFDPPLPIGEHKKVALKCSAAATVQVAARFKQGRA